MARTLPASLLGLVLVASPGCSGGAGEGACFLPGESCDGATCSQAAFCLRDAGPPACVAARANGSTCDRDAECFGSCVANVCGGNPRPCPRF